MADLKSEKGQLQILYDAEKQKIKNLDAIFKEFQSQSKIQIKNL